MNTNGPTDPSLPANGVWLPSRVQRARKPDGSFVGEAPASRDSQWTRKLTRTIPETNFGMREDKAAELVSAAHAAAATGQDIEVVRRRARLMFDAVWIDERRRLEAARDIARREQERETTERAVIARERDATEVTLQVREGRLSPPSGWALVEFVAISLALTGLIACEWLGAATLRKFELQSIGSALVLTSTIVGVTLAAKLFFRRDPAPGMRTLQSAAHVLGGVAVAAWIVMLTLNYATALREDFELPSKLAATTFTLTQFGAAIAVSVWLSLRLRQLMTPATLLKPNPNREWLAHRVKQLDHAVNRWTLLAAREEAEIAAYDASLSVWIATGDEAFQRTAYQLALIQEKIRFLNQN